jgi:hypothetical protein
MNALFPIIGFFAVAFAMQDLRRRHTRRAGRHVVFTSYIAVLAEATAIVASFFAESNGVVLQTIPRHA